MASGSSMSSSSSQVSFSGDGEPEDSASLVAKLSALLAAGRLEDHDGYSIGGSVGAQSPAAAVPCHLDPSCVEC